MHSYLAAGMSISWVHKVGYEVMPDDVLDDVPHRRWLPKRGAARRPSSSMSSSWLGWRLQPFRL